MCGLPGRIAQRDKSLLHHKWVTRTVFTRPRSSPSRLRCGSSTQHHKRRRYSIVKTDVNTLSDKSRSLIKLRAIEHRGSTGSLGCVWFL